MKTLFFFKRLDLALQLCALVIPALFALKTEQYFSAFYLYAAVGGAQLASFLIHAIAGKQIWKVAERNNYGKALATLTVVAAIVLLGISVNDDIIIAGLVVGAAYLVFTPVMAVLYFLICLRETKRVGHAVRREILIVRNV